MARKSKTKTTSAPTSQAPADLMAITDKLIAQAGGGAPAITKPETTIITRIERELPLTWSLLQDVALIPPLAAGDPPYKLVLGAGPVVYSGAPDRERAVVQNCGIHFCTGDESAIHVQIFNTWIDGSKSGADLRIHNELVRQLAMYWREKSARRVLPLEASFGPGGRQLCAEIRQIRVKEAAELRQFRAGRHAIRRLLAPAMETLSLLSRRGFAFVNGQEGLEVNWLHDRGLVMFAGRLYDVEDVARIAAVPKGTVLRDRDSWIGDDSVKTTLGDWTFYLYPAAAAEAVKGAAPDKLFSLHLLRAVVEAGFIAPVAGVERGDDLLADLPAPHAAIVKTAITRTIKHVEFRDKVTTAWLAATSAFMPLIDAVKRLAAAQVTVGGAPVRVQLSEPQKRRPQRLGEFLKPVEPGTIRFELGVYPVQLAVLPDGKIELPMILTGYSSCTPRDLTGIYTVADAPALSERILEEIGRLQLGIAPPRAA